MNVDCKSKYTNQKVILDYSILQITNQMIRAIDNRVMAK